MIHNNLLEIELLHLHTTPFLIAIALVASAIITILINIIFNYGGIKRFIAVMLLAITLFLVGYYVFTNGYIII